MEIVLLDVHELLVITDIFVIASGTNPRQVGALQDEVEKKLKEAERKPLRREGTGSNQWVLLDYGDFIIHIFDTETRAYYDLERLWGDAPRLDPGLPAHTEAAGA
jgi:ribosome-associated protein